jgi:hypothetical protein
MSTQERRELADELERAADEADAQAYSLNTTLFDDLIAVARSAAAALRGEQPVESGQREPSDQQLVAGLVEAAFAAGAYRGDGDLPDEMANAVTVAESALLARLAGGQNS